ncbi:MAG TPA: acetamidase [Anaerolineae bacterium]|nr:acetamidase [Anaerolineae bacterium]
MAENIVRVSTYTGGLVGPSLPMLGPVEDGGTIVAETAPGCWGPMITPKFKGGHEVTQPVAVEGAEVGDAIAIKIKEIKVTSRATSSGTHEAMEGRFVGDPFVARKCPNCGAESPPTILEGIGPEAIRCQNCGAEAIPFAMPCGYTMAFDEERTLGITVGKESAEEIARQASEYAALPAGSEQHPILVLGKADIVGVLTRMRPFIGNIGTTPAVDMPDSHNSGDFGQFLVGAPHEYGLTQEQLEARTDGHLDVDSVRAGAVLICPVKVKGGGVYVGDVHAMQGDGEIAGHTTDVSAEVSLEVEVIKGLTLEGPILLPPAEDLPPLARPFTEDELERGRRLAEEYGVELEEVAPIQVVGSGADLNTATANGLERAAKLLGMSVDEVKNRVTITGAVEIGRAPGLVTVSLLAPLKRLEELGIAHLVKEQYGL